jgi:hypothetical protein
MASDIDTLLAETLDDRAGGDIDPAPLMRYAVTRGRRIRRRRALAGGAAFMVVAILGVATILLPQMRADPEPAPMAPGTLFTGRRPMLPPAVGLVGAAARPELVGTDPRVLHFSVDGLAGTATQVDWQSSPLVESATVTGDGYRVTVKISYIEGQLETSFAASAGVINPAVAVRIGDRTGSMRSSTVPDRDGLTRSTIFWQPTDGFSAMVEAWVKTPADAVRVASLVRFDAAQRCALPFTLPSLPKGMAVRSCYVTLVPTARGASLVQGGLTARDGRREVDIRTSPAPTTGPSGTALTTGPYRVHRDSEGDYSTVAKPYLVNVLVVTPAAPLTQTEILGLFAGLRTRGAPTDPGSW